MQNRGVCMKKSLNLIALIALMANSVSFGTVRESAVLLELINFTGETLFLSFEWSQNSNKGQVEITLDNKRGDEFVEKIVGNVRLYNPTLAQRLELEKNTIITLSPTIGVKKDASQSKLLTNKEAFDWLYEKAKSNTVTPSDVDFARSSTEPWTQRPYEKLLINIKIFDQLIDKSEKKTLTQSDIDHARSSAKKADTLLGSNRCLLVKVNNDLMLFATSTILPY